ncbi:MAG: tetrathionate reductase [Bdellovibrionales bacterium RIFOXYD12_FULL_39_22]|nr:MAG: tetrathionate reductase [Bdellovibrionales bacterium RIFOXYB1_FULL_39_21]OFZ42639.1 MAG: tetrathionate reductase [Bdellovibrionales bacterium RIFOXYC12_FULL_39_17]OFZ47093.1 MAG: tetrathionate reductase [Bdellovibrionales bacterium RIFOXYC1_FULL_39_130]OFZ72378.1 MAG: tetrathionate reductase [Bdellovibrionales bacterium RIFOXYC2_FULL_39_8]OFZ75341.1 MAG: tetrathionate reductase [Bdellovibrionales bacterium RIFOXYD1_FULL_39_84]OFZ93292.1 MAG: tetrathionate reductase [Bdellovibrionales b
MTAKQKHKYAMVIDTRKCVGCGNCVVGCKMENRVPEGLHRDWVVEEVHGTYPNISVELRSERCNHCINPPCVYACPTGASHVKSGQNITLVDRDKCTGCKACIAACPYDVRFIMPEGYVGKCTFCDHRVEQGLDPACVSVCPTHCMHFGDLNNPLSKVSKLLASRKYKLLAPEAGTGPQLYFLL